MGGKRSLSFGHEKHFVKASSSEGDLVLDPFSGVGTTFAVCKNLKRNFIGFELNPDFIAITKERVQQIELAKEYSLFK